MSYFDLVPICPVSDSCVYFDLNLRALGWFKGISGCATLKRITGELALVQNVREFHVNVAERHVCLVYKSVVMLLSDTVATVPEKIPDNIR